MAEPFKNLFNKTSLLEFSKGIKKIYNEFQDEEFYKLVFDDKFENLELKQRMRHISMMLKLVMPPNYEKSIDILIEGTKGKNGFFYMVCADFVEIAGLDNLEKSVEALEAFTKLSSSEFAVRPFIIRYPEKMNIVLLEWAKSTDEHIRRLATEGSRPILPWAMDIPFLRENPSYLMNILENLMADESPYVRKSVANNLNSISKDNPKFVIEFAKRWYGINKNSDSIIKHGLRTLLKAGNPEALEIIGYSNEKINIKNFQVNKEVKLGENLNFSFEIYNDNGLNKIRVEYILHLLRQKEKYNKKIFKISEVDDKNMSKQVEKKHSFREVTTRKYYEGLHYLTIVVNGIELETKEFWLIK